MATFADLSIDRAGAGYTLRASSGKLAGVTSAGFNVKAGTGTELVFRAPPANAVAGEVFAPVTVEVRDSHGNIDTDSTVEVSLSLGGSAGGTLGGTAKGRSVMR